MTEGELAKLLAERAADMSASLKPPWYELRARAYWRKNCQPRMLLKQLETELIGEATGRIHDVLRAASLGEVEPLDVALRKLRP